MADDRPPDELEARRREQLHPLERLFKQISQDTEELRQVNCERRERLQKARTRGAVLAVGLCVTLELLRTYVSVDAALLLIIPLLSVLVAKDVFDV